MKRIQLLLCYIVAIFMLSANAAWAQYVKVTAKNGAVSWIPITLSISGSNIEISPNAISKGTGGSIDLSQVWFRTGGNGTRYNVTSIGAEAFSNCIGLTSVTIPSSVRTIKESAFSGCTGLTSIEIPYSVVSIGNSAFVGCTGLTKVIARDITAWCNISFGTANANPLYYASHIYSNENTEITDLIILSSARKIGDYAFMNCIGLTSLIIPSSVSSIGNQAFMNCSRLSSIKISYGVTSIGQQAFAYCSGLSSIEFPASVRSIGFGAFYNCRGLTSVTSSITNVFATGSQAFYGCSNAILYVPAASLTKYQNTTDWKSFRTIIPYSPMLFSCNNKGKVLVNGKEELTNVYKKINIYDGLDNTFVFLPNENCQVRQVLIDGQDVMGSMVNNQLTVTLHGGSKMLVMFNQRGYDVNGDGNVNISDVVTLVNMILGQ